MDFEPTHDNVLTRRGNPDSHEDTELIQVGKEKPNFLAPTDSDIVGAIVIAIGPEVTCCAKNNVVLYDKHDGRKIENGVEIVRAACILARKQIY